MDPLANLKRQRELIAEIYALEDNSTTSTYEDAPRAELARLAELGLELAELAEALDRWRQAGGFDPYTAKEANDGLR